MVKVIFSYNPYTLVYDIRFNGVNPHINSRVEKHMGEPLQKWVVYLPQILHDEMNGYGFEIEFSGSRLDFELVVDSFIKQGILGDKVKCTLKSELEDRTFKYRRITDLKGWLENNTNHRFDLEGFKNNNQWIYDDSFPVLVINLSETPYVTMEGLAVSVETINSLCESENSELVINDVPIIIGCDRSGSDHFAECMRQIIVNEHAEKDQLFFLSGRKDDIKKILSGFGIADPIMIDSENDKSLSDYILLYPVSSYVRNCITTLREIISEMDHSLQEDVKDSEASCGKMLERISSLEVEIESLDQGITDFENYGTYHDSEELEFGNRESNEYFDTISLWRKKSRNTIYSDEAENFAEGLDNIIHYHYEGLKEKLNKSLTEVKRKIAEECNKIFLGSVSEKESDTVKYCINDIFEDEIIPSMISEFMKIKTQMERPGKSVFDSFFSGLQDENDRSELVMGYDYQQWRGYAIDLVRPLVERSIRIRKEALDNYKTHLVGMYITDLREKMEYRLSEKKKLSEDLTKENASIGKDIDWLSVLKNKVKELEEN